MGVQHLFHQGGGQLAVGSGDGADLVAHGLDGAGLMDADVAGLRGDDRLVGPQQGGDDQGVGLGAAHGEVDLRGGGGEPRPDHIGGLLAAAVQAIAVELGRAGVSQGLQDPGMGGLAVIVRKTVHEIRPRFQDVL